MFKRFIGLMILSASVASPALAGGFHCINRRIYYPNGKDDPAWNCRTFLHGRVGCSGRDLFFQGEDGAVFSIFAEFCDSIVEHRQEGYVCAGLTAYFEDGSSRTDICR